MFNRLAIYSALYSDYVLRARVLRELSWYDPLRSRQTTDNFYSRDTLDYVVELARAGTGERIVTMDSLGVLACPSACRPVFYGDRPIMAVVAYAIPPSLQGEMVFVRVRLQARGPGEHSVTRLDMPTSAISWKLRDDVWKAYLVQYGGVSGRSREER